MDIELNIGLAGAPGANDMARANYAMRLLSSTLTIARVQSRVEQTRYIGPDGSEVVESTLVARAAVRDLDRLHAAIYSLAERLQQDCIAVLSVGDGGYTLGALIGPRAAEWGAFDPQYFVRFDRVAAATEREAA